MGSASSTAENVNSFHYKLALRLYKSALSQLDRLQPSEENQGLVIEALQSSVFLLDEGKFEGAKKLSPEEGHEKYMYLAQISKGSEAADSHRRGIEIIEKSLEATDDADISTKHKLKRALSNAWFSAANLLTVKAQYDEAKQILEKCLSLYWPRVKQALSVLRSRSGGIGFGGGIPFEAHIQVVEMMMELDMFERAAEVLEEDDDHAEVLYLLTVVGKKLWLNSNPDQLRCYAEITKELCANNGDVETVGEMEELLATLPQNDGDSGKELGSDVDAEIPSSIDDGEVMDTHMVRNLLKVTLAGAVVGFLGYCIYFDRKRRGDPEFRTKLAKRRQARALAAQKAAMAVLPSMDDPRAVHRFFLEQIQQGENALSTGCIDEAVRHFAYAVVVCGQPTQLLQVLQQSLSPGVFSKLVASLPEVRKLVLDANNLLTRGQSEEELE
ncbi:hypothetical protein TcWFU_004384 [Taenia crassiceps]|uniref:Mitochondrial import receptor subunit TOM20 n=1 Tax=Taenia crassiceps TaxID=6207 RepID=A0ABR4QGS7_9CEST